MKYKIKNYNKKGFTLIEILLVVGFIALAGIGIYSVFSKTNMANQALNESRNINLIKAGIKNLYGNSQGYTGLSNQVLNDARITPDSMRKVPYISSDNIIINSFGGLVSVTPIVLGGSGINNGFRITYPKIPGQVCAKLVPMMDKNMDQITVNGVIVKSFGTGNLNLISLATSCATDTGNGIDINFDSL
jgi:type II secretory pathway pseudopilin PulG